MLTEEQALANLKSKLSSLNEKGNFEPNHITYQLHRIFSCFLVSTGTEVASFEAIYQPGLDILQADSSASALKQNIPSVDIEGIYKQSYDCLIIHQKNMKGKEPLSDDPFKKCETRKDVINVLAVKKMETKDITKQALYGCMIAVLNARSNYQKSAKKNSPIPAVETALNTLPYLGSAVCLSVCASELAMLYAIIYTTSKAGGYLETSRTGFGRALGKKIQELDGVTADIVNSLIAMTIKFNFSGLHLVGDYIQKMYHLVLNGQGNRKNNANNELASFLLLELDSDFKTPGLQACIEPFLKYKKQLAEQYFGEWRDGALKAKSVCSLVNAIHEIDAGELSEADKITQARTKVADLRRDSFFYKNTAAKVVRESLQEFNKLSGGTKGEILLQHLPLF
ncbi:hypothetical protein ACFORL_01960 [Legionella dresdenensis]|uniref:Substrate of the Dot/Icm secretion system n=1 Tax=Legionella dresdenensis TaxID=450200 RepID=A0ABV8CD17_9GAMM